MPCGNRCNASGAFARSTPLDRPLDCARSVPRGRRETGVDHYPAGRWITGRAPLKGLMYHQRYLAENPDGYCGLGVTGVGCPVGLAV